MRSEAALSRLIGRIYECATAAEGWPDVLADVSAFAGGTRGHFLVFNENEPLPHLSIVGGVDPLSGREYDEHYASTDPRKRGWFAAPNRVVACHQIVDPAAFERTALVNDFLRKWEARYCMVGTFPVADHLTGVWAVM